MCQIQVDGSKAEYEKFKNRYTMMNFQNTDPRFRLSSPKNHIKNKIAKISNAKNNIFLKGLNILFH